MTNAPPAYSRRGLDLLRALASREPLAVDAPAFYFLRHGQTEGNRTRIFQHAEISLNDAGLAQAELAAGLLAGRPIRRILASDMERAWRTAHIVATPHGLPVQRASGLRERWFGDLVGTSSLNFDWALDPPNGETLAVFVSRARAGIAAALAHEETTLLVSHGGVLHVLMAALGVEERPAYTANAAPLLFEKEAPGTAAGWRVTPLIPDADPAPTGSLS